MEEKIINIILDLKNKGDFFKSIVDARKLSKCVDKTIVVIVILKNIYSKNDLQPFHLVLLACLRQNLKDRGFERCELNCENADTLNFLFENLKLGEYWTGDSNKSYITSKEDIIFNIRKLINKEIEFYTIEVVEFLQRKYFQNKDLLAVKNGIIEIMQNIFDHSESGGNAFSYMKYNIEEKRLYVAVCDFGKGIAKSLRDYFPKITNDCEALKKAVEVEVSTKSQVHNRGMGLYDLLGIIGDNDSLRIVSNSAIKLFTGNISKEYSLDYNFEGSLVYFDIALEHFEDKEVDDIFDLNF